MHAAARDDATLDLREARQHRVIPVAALRLEPWPGLFGNRAGPADGDGLGKPLVTRAHAPHLAAHGKLGVDHLTKAREHVVAPDSRASGGGADIAALTDQLIDLSHLANAEAL